MPIQTNPAFHDSIDEMITDAIATMRELAAKHATDHNVIVLEVYRMLLESASGYYPHWTFSLETSTGSRIESRRFAVKAMQHGGHFIDAKSAAVNTRGIRDRLRNLLGQELVSGGWRIHPQSLAPQTLQGWTVLDAMRETRRPWPQEASDPATPHADETEECEQVELDFGMPALFTRIQCAALAIRDGDIVTHSPAIVGIREDGSKRVFVNWEVTFSDPENGERDAIAFASSEIGLRLEAEWDHATRMQEETGVFFISAERMLANLTSEWS